MGASILKWAFWTIAMSAVPTAVHASCTGTPLSGLDPTGASDNSTLIQSAINAAAAAGGGSVVLAVGRYRVAAPLYVKRNVVLCGATVGPFDVVSVDPAIVTVAPTLLIPNTAANLASPFLTLQDQNAGVSDLLFHYPNQALPSALAPDPYPFTVWMAQASTKIERCTVTNAYQFLYIGVGRTIARDLHIGAFFCGIMVDGASDRVTINDTLQTVMWDVYTGSNYTQTNLSQWAMTYGYGFIFMRVDRLVLQNALVFWRYAGIWLYESPVLTQPRSGWGFASNVDIDICQYAIIANSTATAGYQFSNFATAPHPTLGKSAVAYQAPSPGNPQPSVLINGGAVRGPWAAGKFPAFPAPAQLVVVNVLGHNYLP